MIKKPHIAVNPEVLNEIEAIKSQLRRQTNETISNGDVVAKSIKCYAKEIGVCQGLA